MVSTDINIAEWLEVIRADGHEIPRSYPPSPPVEELSGSARLTVESLVTLAQVEYLRRARRNAYMPAS